ncbi:hypothetical protein [uncultured Arcticibacterium sp.]|uniref:hypothetical protein n=1 Tax=uncultured Arcticibacterium sp. TaxID=2173042 RepID=UPI0030F84337
MATDITLSFNDYLISKKIDIALFQKEEPAMFAEWEAMFKKVHPDSFTAQKKFLLNPIRRKYLLTEG